MRSGAGEQPWGAGSGPGGETPGWAPRSAAHLSCGLGQNTSPGPGAPGEWSPSAGTSRDAHA